MSYNIAYGGVDNNGSRIEHIINVVNDANPDFLAIQEAHDFEKNNFERLKKISSETNLPYFEFSEGALYNDGERYPVASFSKSPIKHIYTFDDSAFAHAGLVTTVDSPVGELTLCNVHLHNRSEDERLRSIKTVLDYLSKFEKNIILGDHNALSRGDNYSDLSAEEFTYYELDRFEVADLLNNSHVDTALHLEKNNIGTHPTIGMGHPISKTPIRIDYIFATKPLTTHLKYKAVIKTETAEIASDHYPLTLILE